MLQVDADALRRLGGKVAEHADAIGQIAISAKVTMADSPVQAASDQVAGAVARAFGLIGGNIRQMADRMTTGATSYSDFDAGNADQYKHYLGS